MRKGIRQGQDGPQSDRMVRLRRLAHGSRELSTHTNSMGRTWEEPASLDSLDTALKKASICTSISSLSVRHPPLQSSALGRNVVQRLVHEVREGRVQQRLLQLLCAVGTALDLRKTAFPDCQSNSEGSASPLLASAHTVTLRYSLLTTHSPVSTPHTLASSVRTTGFSSALSRTGDARSLLSCSGVSSCAGSTPASSSSCCCVFCGVSGGGRAPMSSALVVDVAVAAAGVAAAEVAA